jgi:hypothetical protein
MKKRRFVGVITLSCLGLSCSSTNDGGEAVALSSAAITATSNTTVSAWSMTMALPTWGTLGVLAQTITGQLGVSIGANSGAGILVECAGTNKRRAVIAAGGPVTAQPDAKIVDIVATGSVDLRDRVSVVGNVIAPVLTLGNNVAISGKRVTSGTPAAGDALVWTASTPAGTVPGWDLQLCIFSLFSGHNCWDDANNFAHKYNPVDYATGWIPGVGDFTTFFGENFTGLWHDIETNGPTGPYTFYNSPPGLYYLQAGPSWVPGAFDTTLLTFSAATGLSLNAKDSTGVEFYGEYDDTTRAWVSWQAHSLGLTEFSPVDNLALFGKDIYDSTLKNGMHISAEGLGYPSEGNPFAMKEGDGTCS